MSLTKPMVGALSLLLLVAGGCKRKLGPPRPGSPAAGDAAVGRALPPQVPAYAPDPPSADDEIKAGFLTGSTFTVLERGTASGEPAAQQALLADLAQALRLMPGQVRARYLFACLLSLRGDDAGAAAQLEQLKLAGCPACLSALANLSPEDEMCRWGRGAAIEAVRKDLPGTPLHVAALTVLAALESGANDQLEPLLDQGTVKILGDSPQELSGAAAVTAWIAAQQRDDAGSSAITARGRTLCSRDCCDIYHGHAPGKQGLVNGLCFTPEPTPKLRSISLGSHR